jgi:hypothetical protein
MNYSKEPFFGWKPPLLSSQISKLVSLGISKMYKIDKNEEIPLTSVDSSIHKGLKLIHRGDGPKIGKGLVVGSVRMGYGHHRMALSVYSHSLAKKIPSYLHDLLSIESPEANAIGDVDGAYSYFSRLSSDMGGPVEWLWGNITNSGNESSLYFSTLLANQYKRLMADIPKDNPIVTTYPLNGQIAVESGFKRVVHLICDNHPQHYLLVPGALNLVQTEHNLKGFLKMGVPRENLELAGHWITEDILKNVSEDSDERMKRTKNRSAKRFLIPIGGAGAQKSYLTSLIELSKDQLNSGEFKFFLNAGDHEHVYKHLLESVEKLGIEYEVIRSWNDLKEFTARNKLSDKQDSKLKPITLFYFMTHSEGFSATDSLIRISDVLVTKPSELAFYPIPKVFIRRVGDHEEKSALYSLDLGEGSVECREPSHAFDIMLLFLKSPEVSMRMNECVISNAQKQVYSGSKKAVEIAMNS